jgi:hypothetical protein
MENSTSTSISNPFVLISLISWILVLITGWLSFFVPNLDGGFIFMNHVIITEGYNPFPLFMYKVFFYILAIILLFSLTVSFIIYVYNLFQTKDENVLNGMLGNISKFHFIPLLCVAVLFIIGESTDKNDGISDTQLIFFLIFTILALISMIFIYIYTKIDSPEYVNYIIKNGAYSCLISFLIYNLFVVIWEYIMSKKDYDDIVNFNKNCSTAFSILIFLVTLCASFLLKEVTISIFNLIIYIGMTSNFYSIHKYIRDVALNKAIGIFDIIGIILSILMICLVAYRKKKSSN